jgi:hypothetical protein
MLHSLLIRHLILDLCETFLCFPDQIFNDCNCQTVGYSVSNGQKAIKFAQQLLPLVHCVNLPLEAAVIPLSPTNTAAAAGSRALYLDRILTFTPVR